MQARLIGAVALLLFASIPAIAGKSDKNAIPPAKPGHAQLVIVRSSTVNALVGTLVYDVSTGMPEVLGKISNNRKLVLDLAPGDYTFMVGNIPQLDFMKASLLADRRYYVVVTPHWPAHFSMRPFRRSGNEFVYGSAQFNELVSDTKLAPPLAEALDADEKAEKESKSVEFYKVQWEKWQTKSDVDKDILTVRSNDYY